MTTPQERPSWLVPIIVAIIGAVATISVALISRSSPVTPAQPPLPIESFDSTLGWDPYTGQKSSSIKINSVLGRTNNAAEISFSLGKDEWVGIARVFEPGFLVDTKAIRFDYMGSGKPNTLELKLLYAPDDNGNSAVFSVFRNRVTNTRDWTSLEILYSEFICWADTGCRAGERVDLKKVWKIDFAVVNKSSDTPGDGVVLLDNVQGIR